MSIRLMSLQITSNSNEWGSELLLFGNPITLLKGENGSGKTPLILSALFALGYPATFRKDISENCKSVVLTLKINNVTYSIEREYKKQGLWEVKNLAFTNFEAINFSDESTFSNWLFNTAGIPTHKLTQIGEKKFTHAYSSTLLPVCYIDQTSGWQSLYFSINKFIKDQHQEMLRLNLGLMPRHPFERKDALVKEKQNLIRIEELIEQRELVLKELERSANSSSESFDKLKTEKDQLNRRITEIRDQLGAIQSQPVPFESLKSETQIKVNGLLSQRNELQLRLSSATTIKNEIESEVEALLLNTEAADRFRKLCNASKCGLFCATEEAYGKSLLYLKDQMKDLDKNNNVLRVEIGKLEKEISNMESLISETNIKIDKFSQDSGVYDLKKLLEEVSSKLIDVEIKASFQSKIDDQRKKYHTLLENREQAKLDVETLQESSRNVADKDVSEVRTLLSQFVNKWLNILKTPNVKGDCVFDETFNLTIDGDKLSAYKGSTLTRIVLAYHAAVIELALVKNKKHLGFCIMDTPMQQEIKVTDLQDYFQELRQLLKNHANRIQICISFSDANIITETGDEVWTPKYKGDDGKMKYLKTKVGA